MMQKFKRPDTFIWLAFIMMALLFYSSSQTYQEQTSVPTLQRWLVDKPFENLLSTISFTYAGGEVSVAHLGYFKFCEFIIRKGAHFGTYFILGLSWYWGLKPRIKDTWLVVVVAELTTLGYAAFDEFHQMLTGDRTPLFQDVMLDGSGALTGIILTILLYAWWKKSHGHVLKK